MNKILFKHIDNSALVVFRAIFGLLLIFESIGAIFTGWIKRTLIEPKFTFSFIGFEWLQPLPGNGMYVYYAIMGLLGLFIMLGYKYRWSMLAFTIMWTGTYFMQKSSYNNHYYLLMLLSAMMVIQPANRYFSLDAKLHPEIKSNSMPQWCKYLFVLQLFIVYTYASIAKMYPDWLNASAIGLILKSKQHYFLVGELLQEKWVHYCLAYGGILFDGLVIPLMLWKRTRKYAFIASIFFHLFNSFVFQVGIFPYLSLAFNLFFFEPKTIQKLFLKKKQFYNEGEIFIPKYHKVMIGVFSVYFLFQIALPLRHHFIQDDVLWTEEGHRLSWRMMLRAKNGMATYKVIDKATGKELPIRLSDYLTRKQIRGAMVKPDVIWQFSQHLKKDFAEKGFDVEVHVTCHISVNGKPRQELIDSSVDLASVPWEPYKHSSWILPSKQD
ncbi:HTTM domain-containing protein [Mangrovimonas xylaniphaga]|uniref:HTTM domain-containing protein n=1 Tax=Mangrovimonas xylaniphaga TaxID=1645915 RepID=UPI0006B5D9C8|nr:HTTM domain-containing protein [Mangrovimonas xylaniphaga]